MAHAVLIALRFVGIGMTMTAMALLGREQRITEGRGLPVRPVVIATWVGVAVVGSGVAVLAILAA